MTIEENVTGEDDTNVQDAVEQQDAAGQSGETSRNPNAEDFRGMRNSMKEMKGENSTLRNELLQLRQTLTQISTPQQKTIDPFEGRDETDYLTIAEQRKREEVMRNDMLQEKTSLLRQSQALAFQGSNPDYSEVMEKYGKQLPIKTRQYLLRNPSDPEAMEAAYDMCKSSAAFYKDSLVSKEHGNVKRAAENMSKPGAGSSAGSGGTVSLVNKLKNMTKAERLSYSDKCISGGGR